MKNTVLDLWWKMFVFWFCQSVLFSKTVVSLRLKRRLFDQVMLVRRLEEEKLIIVKEMTQHCQSLKKALNELDNLLHKTKEDIKNHSMFHKYFIKCKASESGIQTALHVTNFNSHYKSCLIFSLIFLHFLI